MQIDQLVTSHLWLARAISTKYLRFGLLEDVQQAAAEQITRAAQTYDPNLGSFEPRAWFAAKHGARDVMRDALNRGLVYRNGAASPTERAHISNNVETCCLRHAGESPEQILERKEAIRDVREGIAEVASSGYPCGADIREALISKRWLSEDPATHDAISSSLGRASSSGVRQTERRLSAKLAEHLLSKGYGHASQP